MISIRKAELKDLEMILPIENECFISPWKESDLKYELTENPVNKFYVLDDEGKVVGFLNFMITFNSATISQIAVTKLYRHQGLALKLMEQMFLDLPKDGDEVVEFVTLEVRKSNVAAISLYKKCGFEIIVDKKAYYPDGEDAVYMVKRM
ncbi:MAG: ribosomal protein S18-alanine N-acetyltransferase [Bacilli bacterium]|nr:ribosomal protein S18-alanine N-acetyltransferase [Bacilli bacterium]